MAKKKQLEAHPGDIYVVANDCYSNNNNKHI